MKAIVGIDVSKHKFYATCIKEDKEILFSPELPNQITGFNNLLSILQNLPDCYRNGIHRKLLYQPRLLPHQK